MSKELYENVEQHIESRNFDKTEFPLIKELVKSLSKNEKQILLSLLVFNPNKRPRSDILLEYPFFKTYSGQNQRKTTEEETLSNKLERIISFVHDSSPQQVKRAHKNSSPHEKENSSQRAIREAAKNKQYYEPTESDKNLKIPKENGWWNSDLTGIAKEHQGYALNENRILQQRDSANNYNRYHQSSSKKLQKITSQRNSNTLDPPKSSQRSNVMLNDDRNKVQFNNSSRKPERTDGDVYIKTSPRQSYRKENIIVVNHPSMSGQKV